MQRDVVLILGKTGSGKTTFLREHLKTATRSLVVDADFCELPGQPCSTLDELLERLESQDAGGAGFFRCIWTPALDELAAPFVVAREYGPILLTLEEADRFPPPAECPEYAEIIARGRHYGVSIAAASLYPFALPAELRRQATRIVSFRQHEPRDIDWLSAVLGEAAEQLPDLPQHAYLDWSPETGAVKKGALSL